MNRHIALIEGLQFPYQIREKFLLFKRVLQGQLCEELVDLDKLLIEIRVLEDGGQPGSSAGRNILYCRQAVLLEFAEEWCLVALGMQFKDILTEDGKGKLFQVLASTFDLVLLVNRLLVSVTQRELQQLCRQLSGRIEKLESRQLPRPIVRHVNRRHAEV